MADLLEERDGPKAFDRPGHFVRRDPTGRGETPSPPDARGTPFSAAKRGEVPPNGHPRNAGGGPAARHGPGPRPSPPRGGHWSSHQRPSAGAPGPPARVGFSFSPRPCRDILFASYSQFHPRPCRYMLIGTSFPRARGRPPRRRLGLRGLHLRTSPYLFLVRAGGEKQNMRLAARRGGGGGPLGATRQSPRAPAAARGRSSPFSLSAQHAQPYPAQSRGRLERKRKLPLERLWQTFLELTQTHDGIQVF